jgi:XTP/dITP diphosphohydrolase
VKIVLASGNRGKLRELSALLSPLGHELLAQDALGIESPPETGDTFAANAMIKARHAAGIAGCAALADDSGLEVDALDGRPGVRSARFAGEDATDEQNLVKLLSDMQDVPDARRTARFQCVIVLVRSAADASPLIASGTWEGRITRSPRGSHGFGYDPVFVPAGLAVTSAELDPAEKNVRSHRAQALRALVAKLQKE